MKMSWLWAAVAAAALCAGLVFADAKDTESQIEKKLDAIGAKLDTLLQNQAKLDTIIQGQQDILETLRVRRLH